MDLVIKSGENVFFPNYPPVGVVTANFAPTSNINYATKPENYPTKQLATLTNVNPPVISVSSNDSTTTNIITIAKEHKCTLCNRNFVDDNRLMIHMKRHTDNKPTSYECTICFKTFTQQGNLKTHYRIHTNEKPYSCDVCSKDFRQLSGLKAHQRTHLDFRPYKCNTCPQEFHQSSALRAHICPNKPPTGPQPTTSNAASTVTANQAEMENMMAYKMLQRLPGGEKDLVRKTKAKRQPVQHTQRTNVVRIEYNPVDGNLSFNCDRCSRKFKRKDDLDIHMLIHTNTSQFFECTQCEKKFVQLGNLKTHLRVHSGEKPYQCAYCQKGFRQLSGMITHERIHSDEKPFQCSACDRRFRQLSGLNSHIAHCKQLLTSL